jgi:type 1 fimbriae regulatory protein FimB/type 1 fimbriae regulatory protein FimE
MPAGSSSPTTATTRAIQAYFGHRSIMSTVRYTAMTPNRFKNFWKD